MSLHRNLTLYDLHAISAFSYANAAARTGAGGFVTADIGKIAWQTDDDSFWVLKTIAPSWVPLGSGGGGTYFGTANQIDLIGNTFSLSTTIITPGSFTASPASANVTLSPTGTGIVTINPATAGTIDNMVVGATTASTGRFTTVESTISTGTAPFIVASTTQVTNLNAATAGTATNATNVGVTAINTNATYYPTFVSATTGNLPIDVDSDLTYNPSTNKLSLTTLESSADIKVNTLTVGGGAGSNFQYNTVLGYLAGSSNTTAVDFVAVGYRAGKSNTTGGQFTGIGMDAGRDHISGDNFTAIGTAAGAANTTGSNDLFIGTGAGAYETGSNKLYIDGTNTGTTTPLIYGVFDPAGGYAGSVRINGSFSTAYDAVINTATVGSGGGNVPTNTVVGNTALPVNTTGYGNTAIGSNALNANTTGYSNTAIGHDALLTNVSGVKNIAIGDSAGTNETGSNKLYIDSTATGTATPLIYGEFDPTGGKAGFVKINGGLHREIKTITTNYPATDSDDTILCDTTSGGITITLQTSPKHGDIKTIKKIDSTANTIIIDGNGKNIDGVTTQTIYGQYIGNTIQFDTTSSTWNSIASDNARGGIPIIQDPYAGNTSITQAHGLANNPDFLVLFAYCLTNDNGYVAGDLVYTIEPESAVATTDILNITLSTGNIGLRLIPKGGGAIVTATSANWAIYVLPYAFL